jgi:hypothetical protein
MPYLVMVLLGGLVRIAPYIAGQVLIGLGFGFVSYSGVSVGLGFLKSQVVASIGGLPASIVGLLGFMHVGSAVSIIFSAIVVRNVLDGLSSGGSISKLVKK